VRSISSDLAFDASAVPTDTQINFRGYPTTSRGENIAGADHTVYGNIYRGLGTRPLAPTLAKLLETGGTFTAKLHPRLTTNTAQNPTSWMLQPPTTLGNLIYLVEERDEENNIVVPAKPCGGTYITPIITNKSTGLYVFEITPNSATHHLVVYSELNGIRSAETLTIY
jgi:hypothetical protein